MLNQLLTPLDGDAFPASDATAANSICDGGNSSGFVEVTESQTRSEPGAYAASEVPSRHIVSE